MKIYERRALDSRSVGSGGKVIRRKTRTKRREIDTNALKRLTGNPVASRTHQRQVQLPRYGITYEPKLSKAAAAKHRLNRQAVHEAIAARLTALEAEGLDPTEVRHRLARDLRDILKESGFDASGYVPKGDGENDYGKYLLHSGLTGHQPFAIQIFVFAPGQKTPVHDHPCECRSLVWEGDVTERHYRGLADEVAVEKTMRDRRPGDSALLVPDRPNIHSIENPSPHDRAVTVHFYFMDGIEQPAAVDTVYRASHLTPVRVETVV